MFEWIRLKLAVWLFSAISKDQQDTNNLIAGLRSAADDSKAELAKFKQAFNKMQAELDEVAANFGDNHKLLSAALQAECPECSAPWAEHRCPYTPTKELSSRVCEICQVQLPIETHRTSDGKWRCRQHKVA